MRILCDEERIPSREPELMETLKRAAKLCLKEEGIPDERIEISLSFVSMEEIHELNNMYRQVDRPTDVLSFECDGVDDDLSAMTLAEDPVYELGDVVIAPDVASRQTREFGTTFEEEISLLLVHGLLHLCGYDHIADDEAEVMEKREAEILEAWSKRTV